MSVWLSFVLVSFGASAKYLPPTSNTLKFRGSCAHALDDWAVNGTRVREMQRWFGVFLRDPGAISVNERLGNVYAELYDEAVDRLADLPRSSREIYAGYLAKTGLGDGIVPGARDAERFLFILNGMQLMLRAGGTVDFGAVPGAGVMLAVITGVLNPESVVIDHYDFEDLGSRETFIEARDWKAFTVVEDTVGELRRRNIAPRLAGAFVGNYRYRRAALLQTIANLEATHAVWPERIRESVQELRELRVDYEVDEEHQSVAFGRMVGILREIETYGKLAEAMNALRLTTLEDY